MVPVFMQFTDTTGCSHYTVCHYQLVGKDLNGDRHDLFNYNFSVQQRLKAPSSKFVYLSLILFI
jgi:hypothetical protein